MNADLRTNRILKVPLTVLSWLGLVQFEDEIFPWLHTVKGYTVISMFISYNISEMIFLIINRDDMTAVTIIGGTAALYFTFYTKALSSLINKKKFSEMFENMHEKMKEVEQSDDAGAKEVLDKHVKWCRLIMWSLQSSVLVLSLAFMSYLVAICFIFRQPGEPIHPFCVDTWFPFATEDHPILTFSIFFSLAVVDCGLLPQWNGMAISMLVYGTCMLRILQHKIQVQNERFLEKQDISQQFFMSDIKQNEEYYRFLVCRIEEHLTIIRFLDDLKEILSFPMGVDFMNFVLILCGQAFMGSKLPYSFELFFSWTYLIFIMFLALLYYWHATETSMEGQQLASAVYESAWYKYEANCRRASLLMIQRSHRSITLKAGLLPMNLGTFIMMLRASYSAFTILRQINN